MDKEALKELYVSNEAVKAFCDHMAQRDRNQGETKLKRILSLLADEKSPVRKPEMIAAFRELERVGCGQYVVGRHRWPSRFVWSVKSLTTCQLAQGSATESDETAIGDYDESESEELEHTYNLRADFQVRVSLPMDLSESEAERLAGFVRSLPMDDYQE